MDGAAPRGALDEAVQGDLLRIMLSADDPAMPS